MQFNNKQVAPLPDAEKIRSAPSGFCGCTTWLEENDGGPGQIHIARMRDGKPETSWKVSMSGYVSGALESLEVYPNQALLVLLEHR